MDFDWTTALPDWESRIINRKSIIPCEPLNTKVADTALDIFCSLKLVDVIGEPTIGEVAEQWILDFVAVIFGAYDPVSKRRYIRYFYLLISKKNSKSSYAAAIMLTALILNERKQGELFIIAPTVKVAGNSFKPMQGMIKADDELRQLFIVKDNEKKIVHRETDATLQVVAAEGDTVSGIKGIYVLFDEIHVFGKRANASDVFLEAEGGQKTFQEGFVIYLTTHAKDEPAGIHKEKLDYARAVLNGEIEDRTFLPVMYEMPRSLVESDQHLDADNWYITNPNLNKSVHLDDLIIDYGKAEFAGDEAITGFLAKHVNVEVGMALAHNGWAGAEYWLDASKDFTLDDLIKLSEVIAVGVDGGGLDDLLGYSAIGRLPNQIWWLWVHAWCHKILLKRHKQIITVLEDFERDGDLTIIDDHESGKDSKQAAEITKKIHDSGKLFMIGFDNAKKDALVEDFELAGIPRDLMIGVPQGFKLIGPIQKAERGLVSKTLVPSNQRLMNWCVGNAKVKNNGTGTLIVKQQGHRKIDPLMATFNAVALMSQNPEAPKPPAEMRIRTLAL